MTYAAAITDLKAKMTTAKNAVSTAMTDMLSVTDATSSQASDVTSIMQNLNNLLPNILRMEAMSVPTA